MRKRYDAERGAKTFYASLQFGDAGLMLGRGTVLVENGAVSEDLATGDLERIAVLLSTTYGGDVSPHALHLVSRAMRRWREGDSVLAHIELAFARLPRLEGEDDAFRLFLIETLLDEGWTPQWLARELGFDADLGKYDPDQPRVPAGSGRASGQWGSASSRETLLGLPAAGSASGSFLADAAPGIVRALASFAARFSVPTAVLGALFIPTPNSGGVTQGTLPDASGIRFRRDGPAGTLRLATTLPDGSVRVALARNQGGVLVDVATKEPLGRDFGEQLYLDLAAVQGALAPRERSRPAVQPDDPQLCPAPVLDTPHGPKEHTLDHEEDLHARVNPIAPLPRGFAVRIIDPLTGEDQYPDDCFRYAGDLVDRDMRPGDFADAKGEEFARLLAIPALRDRVMGQLVDQATRHARAARARGAGLKIYFAEQNAADKVRDRFREVDELRDVVIGFLPPSRPKQKGRSR